MSTTEGASSPTYAGLGMVDVNAEGRVLMVHGGTPTSQFDLLTFTQLRDWVRATGQLSSDELDRFAALLDDADFAWMGAVMMTVWGRRPTG
jgi:hypothetical protein